MIHLPIARRTVRFGGIELAEWLKAAAGGEIDDPRAVAAFEEAFGRLMESGAAEESGTEGARQRSNDLGPSSQGGSRAVAFPSGRVALVAVLKALELPAGSEVILSAYNDESVPVAILHAGLRPRFVDVREATQNLDPERVAEAVGPSTSAILATHLFGNACEIGEVGDVARRKGLALIEDCAHALGVRLSGRCLGSFGDASFFSFSATKPHSALGGGMAFARDESTVRALRAEQQALAPPRRGALLRAGAVALGLGVLTRPSVFAMSLYPTLLTMSVFRVDPVTLYRATGGRAIRADLGAPGRLTGNQARVGLAMLARVERDNRKRLDLAQRLRKTLPPEVWTLPAGDETASGAYFFLLRSPDPVTLARRLLRRGVDTGSKVMRPCHLLFRAAGELPATDAAFRESLQIPLHSAMGADGVDALARAVRLEWQAHPELFRRTAARSG